jgi:hypothetical protein
MMEKAALRPQNSFFVSLRLCAKQKNPNLKDRGGLRETSQPHGKGNTPPPLTKL